MLPLGHTHWRNLKVLYIPVGSWNHRVLIEGCRDFYPLSPVPSTKGSLHNASGPTHLLCWYYLALASFCFINPIPYPPPNPLFRFLGGFFFFRVNNFVKFLVLEFHFGHHFHYKIGECELQTSWKKFGKKIIGYLWPKKKENRPFS